MSEDVFDGIDFDAVTAPTTEGRVFPKLRPSSWFMGTVVEEVIETTEGGAKCLTTTLAPMAADGTTSKPTCRHKTWLPRRKFDEDTGKEIPWNGFGFLAQYARAFEGREVVPYAITKYKGTWKDAQGNELTQDEARIFNEELTNTVLAYIKDRVANVGSGVGKEVYFKTTPLEQGKYVNVERISDQLPFDKETGKEVECLTDPETWSIV